MKRSADDQASSLLQRKAQKEGEKTTELINGGSETPGTNSSIYALEKAAETAAAEWAVATNNSAKSTGDSIKSTGDDPSDADKSPAASASNTDSSEGTTPPYRKAKNFAERFMRVVQGEHAPDSLWWVGGGKGVAIHKKHLKKSPVLASHFNIKDYNVFSRNLNRWGFRRTTEVAVPDGVRVYQCSLFQKDAAHLVHHMRMDSDVQDVFIRHSDTPNEQGVPLPRAKGRKGKAASQAQQSQQQIPPGGLQQQNNELLLKYLWQQQQQNSNQSGGGHAAGNQGAQTAVLQGSGVSGQLGFGCNSFQGQPRAPVAATGNVPDAASLQMVLNAMNTMHSTTTAPPQQDHVSILKSILELSDQYVQQPQGSSTPLGKTIMTTVQLLRILGQTYQKEQEQQQQAASAPTQDPSEQLLQVLQNRLGSASSSGPQQSSPAALQQELLSLMAPSVEASSRVPAATQEATQNNNFLMQLLASARGRGGDAVSVDNNARQPQPQGIASSSAASHHQPQQQQQQPEAVQAYLNLLLRQNNGS